MAISDRLSQELEHRAALNCLRTLTCKSGLADFCSNDYLGLATDRVLPQYFDQLTPQHRGSTGSRLLSGNSSIAETTEAAIAAFVRAESALVFGSGYDANVGLFSALGNRSTTILFDELSHASVRDGIRLGFGRAIKFKHNDLHDLEEKLQRVDGEVIVAVESVYSMDGDVAPLAELADLCEQSGVELIVDEAHATGVYGAQGEGACVAVGIEARVLARVHTFGKALGAHGGVVVGKRIIRDYLINFARSFIYATAPSATFYGEINAALKATKDADARREKLWTNCNLFAKELRAFLPDVAASSPVFSVLVPGNFEVKDLSQSLQRHGFDARPILSPTVKQGAERLRISIHAHNTEDEIRALADCLRRSLHPEFINVAHG